MTAEVEAAVRVYRRALLRGPVPCAVVNGQAQGIGIRPYDLVRARRALGIEVIRDERGIPRYRLPSGDGSGGAAAEFDGAPLDGVPEGAIVGG